MEERTAKINAEMIRYEEEGISGRCSAAGCQFRAVHEDHEKGGREAEKAAGKGAEYRPQIIGAAG